MPRGMGGRPAAEFVDGDRRRRGRRPERSLPVELPAPGHIDLRIVRHVDVSTSPAWDWYEFLDDLGSSNRQLGSARSLGSVAMTYVPAKHMMGMLEEKYPRDFHHHKRKLELFRRFNANIHTFLRERQHNACLARVDEVAADHADRAQRFRDFELDEILEEAGMPRSQAEPRVLTPEDQEKLDTYNFGPQTFSVRAIDFYGRNHIGLDLSRNQAAYQERHEVVGFLRTEGLPVRVLDADWAPHATVFDLLPHVQAGELGSASRPPVTLSFSAPTTETYGI